MFYSFYIFQAQQLERDNFTNVKSVEDYADQVNASLYFLMLECLSKSV